MSGKELPFILERVRRCRSCGTEMKCSPLAYEETPYCSGCLASKLKSAEPAHWQKVGAYVEFSRGTKKPVPGVQ